MLDIISVSTYLLYNMLLYLLLSLSLADEFSKDYILQNYDKCINCTEKSSQVEVLGFVSYWNPIGYQYAEEYGIKFDYISPTWYSMGLQTSRDVPAFYELSGIEDTDTFFLREITSRYTTKIVPRVLFTKGDEESYRELLTNEDKIYELADTLYQFLLSTNYYGLVFEIFPFLDLFIGDPDLNQMKRLQLEMIKKVAEYLKERDYKLMLVIPGYYPNNVQFTDADFLYLSESVFRFITINYDYSWGEPGPNNPIDWIEDTVKYYLKRMIDSNGQPIGDYYYYAKKLMIGVSFYGYQYTKNNNGKWSQMYILGSDYLSILKNQKTQILWNDKYAEQLIFFESNGKPQVATYPTQVGIQRRVELAKKLGTGIAIWELGQGLPYLFQPL